MGISKKIICICFLWFSISTSSQEHFEKISLGEYEIGFRSMTHYDLARPAIKEQTIKEKGRVLQVNVWYPTPNCGNPKNNFNDYVNLIAKEVNPIRKDDRFAQTTFYDWTFQNRTPSPEILAFKKNGMKMKACPDSQPSKGSFPVVLLIHGGAADFAFLGEFLASHGYIVLNVPYKGFLQTELDVDVLGMETEVKDFEFALEWIKDKMPMDDENISVVGASFGGQSAVYFSLRNKLNCIVSLDGGIGSAFGAGLLQSDKSYDVKKLVAPLLHIYNPNDTYTDVSFIRKYKYCNRTLVSMMNMEHAHFWSWGVLDHYIPNVIGEIRPGNSYEAVLQETLNFIEKNAKNRAMDCDWCGQYQISIEHLKADRIPATSD